MDQSPQGVIKYSRESLLAINDNLSHHHEPIPGPVFNTLLDLGISKYKPTKRGKKAGKKHRQKMASISLYSLNCQSVGSKSTRGIITDIFAEHDIDIFALQETWLADDPSHNMYVSQITPPGYDIYNVPRGKGDNHGGVAVVFKEHMKVVSKSDNRDRHFKTFEYCELLFTNGSKCFTLADIYRPYPSSVNKLTTAMFLEEISQFLQDCAISKGDLVVVGDFNIHLNKIDDPDTRRFNQLIESLGLIQTAVGPTHRDGNTLDVVLSREMDSLVKSTRVLDLISDHRLIACVLTVSKPSVPRKTITSRKLRSIDQQSFTKDIESSILCSSPTCDVTNAVEQYNKSLSELLNKHAPLCTRTVTPKDLQPWFSDSLHQMKRERRKAERKWISSGLTVDLDHFKMIRNQYNVALYHAKCSFFNNKINDCGNDFRSMFSVIGEILHSKQPSRLPDHDSASDLANHFAEYFMTKIENIRCALPDIPLDSSSDLHCTTVWNELTAVSEADVMEIITKSPSPSCLLDPLPSWMVKQHLDVLLPVITSIVNRSLAEGVVPELLKTAIIIPLLKKATLDCNILKNYRPVSNLPFISKILERVVAKQLTDHMSLHQLHEPFQSAYKQFHSTETALIRVHNDIMWAMEEQGVTILVLLDLSSAFDTIDHRVLLSRLQDHVGVCDIPLKWFTSYLAGRSQRVYIDGHFSTTQFLRYGVPQGSVLGPLLFSIYTLPLGRIIRNFGFALHIYADDTQIYASICPTSADGVSLAVSNIETCVSEIQNWMSQNFLKLNAEKTEVIVCGFRAQLCKFHLSSVNIAGVNVPVQTNAVRNLGVMFDCNMSMSAQVNNVVKSANYHLINIGRARKMLTTESTKMAVHALVTSRIDYCNSLLAGISESLLKRLVNIQRTAARIVTRKRKYDPISHDLVELHWLPIKQRIDFKIIVLVYKCLHQTAPNYLAELLHVSISHRRLRSNSTASYRLTEHRTQRITFADRSFSCYGPKLWNSLPEHIKSAASIDNFKKLLKHHLFNLAYDQ